MPAIPESHVDRLVAETTNCINDMLKLKQLTWKLLGNCGKQCGPAVEDQIYAQGQGALSARSKEGRYGPDHSKDSRTQNQGGSEGDGFLVPCRDDRAGSLHEGRANSGHYSF